MAVLIEISQNDTALTLTCEPGSAMAVRAASESLSGSMIGSIKETQEMLDFCGKHNIVSDIEIIRIQDINEAFERVVKATCATAS